MHCAPAARAPAAAAVCQRRGARAQRAAAAWPARRQATGAAAAVRRLALAARAREEEDDYEDEPEDVLEDEDELDEADFADLDNVTFTEQDRDAGPIPWSDYYTRFLSPDVMTQEQARAAVVARRQQHQQSVAELLARVPGLPAREQAGAAAIAAAVTVGPSPAEVQEAPLLPTQRINIPGMEDTTPPEPTGLDRQMKVWQELWDPPPEPRDQWDLRAAAEKQRRKEREHAEWLAARARVGQHSCAWSDWRTDARITGTGDPTQPQYHEWSHREIWDMICQGGGGADPRVVRHRTASPYERADFVEQGARYHPESDEWIESLGKLIPEASRGAGARQRTAEPRAAGLSTGSLAQSLFRAAYTDWGVSSVSNYRPVQLFSLLRKEEEDAIVDREAEAALLDSEFVDFDEQLGADYGDAGFADDGFAAAVDF
eukprot:scaffold21.g2103.t1